MSATRSMSSVTSIIGFAAPRGRALLAFYGLGSLAVALLNLGGLSSPYPSYLALALLAAALVLLGLPSGEPFDLRLTIAVVVLAEGMTAAMAWNIADPAEPGFAAWHQGAVTFVLLMLLLRGRRVVAWGAYGGFAVLTLAAALTIGQPLAVVANDVARQAGTLLIGTLFSIVLRRSVRAISAAAGSRVARVARDAAAATTIRERSAQTARLERDARPALERLLVEVPLREHELAAIALLEQSLRDGITAAGFTGDRLAEEIRMARHRGIRVVLADDRGTELSGAEFARVEQALVSELRMVRFGTVAARLSAVDRPELATVLVDEGGRYRSVVVGPESVDISTLS